MKSSHILIAAGLTLLAASASATVIHVDLNGGGDYLTIGEGMAAASDGDTVLIAPGEYTGPDNRNLDPGGKNLVIVGAAGPDSTIISCSGEGRGFHIHSGEDSTCVIEGLTIRDGFETHGAGARITDSSPTFRKCVFRENNCGWSGGGVRCTGASPLLEDCLFLDNGADEGAGMYAIHGGHVTLTNVVFDGNQGDLSRGGLVCASGTSSTLTDVLFSNNSRGAMSCNGGGTHILTNVTFARNYNADMGGGIYVREVDILLDGCTFVRNRGTRGSAMGIVYPATNCTVTRTILSFGLEGPLNYYGQSDPTFTHCCVFGNAGGDSLGGTHYDNIFVDPCFCDLGGDDFTLHDHSQCLPEHNPWGERIGAFWEGCLYPGPLPPPEGFTVSPDDRRAYLSWRWNPDSYLAHYRIERDTTDAFGAGTASFATEDTLFIDSPLENWREYFYRVSAIDTLWGASEPSDTVSCVAHPTAPSVPTGLAAVGRDGVVDLSWNWNPEPDVTHYAVYRDTVSGFTPGEVYGTSVDPAFADSAVLNYRSYYYRVAGVDTGGLMGDACDEARGVPHGVPPAVLGLEVVPGDSSAVLVWRPLVPPCQAYYRVYRDTTPDMHSLVTFHDGFESYEVGSPPSSPPWTVIEQSGTAARVTDSFQAVGTKSLAVSDSSFGYLRLYHSVDDTTSESPWVCFHVRPGDVGGETNLLRCEVIGEAGMGYQSGVLEVRDGFLRHWVQGSGSVVVAPCDPEEWHMVDWHLDCRADTYGIWLDGEHILGGAPFYREARYLDVVQFRTRSQEWSEVWLDDVFWLDHQEVVASTTDTTHTDGPLSNGQLYYYKVAAVDTFGAEGLASEVVSVVPGWTAVDEGTAGSKSAAALYPNRPNPFGARTALAYQVPAKGAHVTVRIYDVSGRLVRTLVDGHEDAGVHRLVWRGRCENGRRVASGVYLCRASIGDWSRTRKIVVLR